MKLVLSAFIPGPPQPKERPRFGNGTVRSGTKTSAWEKHARQVLQFARQQAGMSGPVARDVPLSLDALFVFPRVQRLGDGPRARHLVKPDGDNVLKALKDALDGGKPARKGRPGTPGLIVTDDCQITSTSTAKWYAATGEKPGVHLRLWRLDQAPDIGPGKITRTDSSSSSSASPAIRPLCKPHHRWMGGKQKLLGELLAVIPSDWRGHYRAPCVGAGALFYALHGASRLTGATLSDACGPLVGHLQNLRQDPEDLIRRLAVHREKHAPDYWRTARARFNTLTAPAAPYHDPDVLSPEVAALFLYLNATSFQGMFRVNSSGGFNVPRSKDRGARHILTDERAAQLRVNAEALRPVELQITDLHASIAQAQAGELLYVDPPYWPGKNKTGFTAYTTDGFSLNDQRLLHRSLGEARDRGVLVMTSNSAEPEIREFYADGWHIHEVNRPGTASSGDNRHAVAELLITSWAPEAT